MELIPVLDVRRGRAVKAAGGDRTRYPPLASVLAHGSDPCELARACRTRLGTDLLYAAHLDAIESGGRELRAAAALVRRLAADGVRLWIDAGASEVSACTTLLEAGAERVVVGLETLRDRAALSLLPGRLGPERLVFSLDLRGGRPLARALPGGAATGEIARAALAGGFSTLVALDFDRVGSGDGPACRLLERERAQSPGASWIAGGGVRDGIDLRALAAAGWDGCLVGTAIHQGRVGREEVEALGRIPDRAVEAREGPSGPGLRVR